MGVKDGGAHQFPEWEAEEDVGDEDTVFTRGGLTSSESDFFSNFFGPLSPVYPDLAVATAAAAAQNIGVTDSVRVQVGGGGDGGVNEEVAESSANKAVEAKPLWAASSNGTKIEQQEAGGSCDHQQKRKRNRTTEMHNLTERRRRDKIKGKLKALQDLIPNSHKLDRASLLDEAIVYVKSLQMQVQMMSGGSYSPCMSPPPAVCLHMPHFSPFSRMGMGYGMGMGMATMGCPVGPPLMSIPSPHQATSYVPMPGYSTYPSFCPLSQGVPFAPIPEFAAAMATSIPSPPTLQPGPFSVHRRESGSQEAGTTQNPNVYEPISSTC